MRYLYFVFVMWCLLVVSAQAAKKIMKLSGMVAGHYPVTMLLAVERNSVMGYYCYNKYKTKLLLSGTLTAKSITLCESCEAGFDYFRGFVGTCSGKLIRGLWIDKDKKLQQPFRLTIDTVEYMTCESKMKSTEGCYESERNSSTEQGMVQLQHIAGNFFCFEITTVTAEGCAGALKGLVEFRDMKTGTYTESLCQLLTFTLDGNTVTVTEEKCDYHGDACRFAGRYKRSVKVSKW